MTVRIELVGPPRIVDGEQVSAVRGHKSWALLARLLLADRPLGRQQLATELFPDTDDPLGSLRWCLAALRRALRCSDCLTGDPIEVRLPPGTTVDVWSLGEPAAPDAPLPDGELLEGLDPSGGPEMASWLVVERARIASTIDAELRKRTIAALSVGADDRAVEVAGLLVRRQPFDESAHVLLVRSLVGAGHADAAERHVAQTTRLFRDELGVEPSAGLASAARATVAAPALGVSPAAVARSSLDSGLAALNAGAVDAGLDCLRGACEAAERSGDGPLTALTWFELGCALVHAVRGFDDEGAVLLGRASAEARRIGVASIAAAASRELGYIDALAGRRPTAATYLGDAFELADDDPDLLAGIHAVVGMNLVDWGRRSEGLEHYEHSIELARSAGKPRREAWSLGLGAWGLLVGDDLPGARRWLDRCVDLVDSERWMAFRPWPQSLLGEIDLREGADPGTVATAQEATFALSNQLQDPCWEGTSGRTIALALAAAGDHATALDWIADARIRCCRHADTFVSMEAWILAADAEISTGAGDTDRADATARELLAVAARAHMDDLVDRAYGLLSGPQ